MTPSTPVVPVLLAVAAALVCATLVAGIAPSLGFPLPPGHRRIGCADGLRGYLALFVVAHHFIIWSHVARTGEAWGEPTVAAFNNFGASGVALFFMTTGLVFYPRILTGFRRTSWLAVLTTRVFRIVPLVALSTALVGLILWIRTGTSPGFRDLKAAAVWISCWSQPPLFGVADSGRVDAYVLWSLRYEWVFYLVVLPSCALAMDFVRPRAAAWTLPIGLLAFWLSARSFQPASALAKYLPLFAIGMLAFEVQRVPALRRLLGSSWMTLPAGASLVAGLVSAPNPYGLPQLAFLGFFFVAVACGNSLFGSLRTRGSLALGECSYAIYLLHGITFSLVFVEGRGLIGEPGSDASLLVLPGVAVVLACATPLVHVLFERPFIRLGRRIAAERTGRRLSMTDPMLEVAP